MKLTAESLKDSGVQSLIAAWLISLLCAGCVSPQKIANHVLQAPNQHIKIPEEFQELGILLATNFPVERISVGPPPATLELMIMAPGDYGVQMKSTFTEIPPLSPRVHPHYDFHFAFDLSHFTSKPKAEQTRGTIFLLPGYGLDKEAMMPWGLVLAKAGYQAVLVDLRGNGHSTGDHIYFGGIERTDMVQCLNALAQRRICNGAAGLLGVSYGAVLGLQWAAIDPRVRSVVAISPYLNPQIAVDRYLKTFAPNFTWSTDRKVAADVAARLAGFSNLDTESAVKDIHHRILFIRAEHDEVCSKEDLDYLQKAAPPGSKISEVPLANHLFVGMCISQLSDVVTNWFHDRLNE